MPPMSHVATLPSIEAEERSAGVVARFLVIALTAFLTVVDLFATQAILPSLTRVYGVSPAAMGSAVNASTLGMAIAGLCVAIFSRRIDRRRGILISLAILAIPTALLAAAPNLAVFTMLRIARTVHGVRFHADARLSRRASERGRRGDGVRRLHHRQRRQQLHRPVRVRGGRRPLRARVELLFLRRPQSGRCCARLFHRAHRASPARCLGRTVESQFASWALHLRNPRLRASFGIGFCILFAFIGTFTYINFVLVRPPFMTGPMELGFVYFVFLPSVLTTPLAGRVIGRLGTRATF
jgi:YNFM family putative membrane transporter